MFIIWKFQIYDDDLKIFYSILLPNYIQSIIVFNFLKLLAKLK